MRSLNESFLCEGCGASVEKAQGTSRNHCPFCFLSKHVDGAIPGDRAAECHAPMIPVSYVIANGGIKIRYECTRPGCDKVHNNKVLQDDEIGALDASIARWKAEYDKTL